MIVFRHPCGLLESKGTERGSAPCFRLQQRICGRVRGGAQNGVREGVRNRLAGRLSVVSSSAQKMPSGCDPYIAGNAPNEEGGEVMMVQFGARFEASSVNSRLPFHPHELASLFHIDP